MLWEQLNPWPSYIPERLELYQRLKKESDANLAKQAANSKPISVQLPDGQKVEARSWVTTPYQLACGVRWATGIRYYYIFFKLFEPFKTAW